MKNVRKNLIFIITVLLVHACQEKEQGKSSIENIESFGDSLYADYKAEVLEANTKLLNGLFDDVAYKSLDLVLTDRAYESKPEEAPKLKSVRLEDMKGQVKGESPNDNSIREYIRKFILLRDSFLQEEFNRKTVFVNLTDSITQSEVYIDNILKDKATDSIYIDLTSRIKKSIKTAQDEFELTKTKIDWLDGSKTYIENNFKIRQQKTKNITQDFGSTIKNYSLLLFWLLAGSLILNLILGILFFRKREKNSESKKEDMLNVKRVEKPALPSTLSQRETTTHISKAFQKLKSNLSLKYHKDCVATQITELQSLERTLLDKCKSQKFNNTRELDERVSPVLEELANKITQKLDAVIDRHGAQQIADKELDTENFVLKYVSSIISEKEISDKVSLLKRRFNDDMPLVMSKMELKEDINEMRTSIKRAIEKMMKENSQLYFPFADAQGVISDSKRSTEKERDSALIFVLHPEDNTRATFQLLYEYSDMMQAGIQSYDVLLLPICDLKSEDFDRNGTIISQNGQDGEMILENGKWRVHSKLSIKIT